jgi:DNA-binding transcriptional LysR family regulator
MDWTRRIRVQHLQLLVTLAETGSISEAARISFSTQPALSKWLKELEENVGAPLFERHARGLKTTVHGNMLLGHAQRVLSEMDRYFARFSAKPGAGSHHAVPASTPQGTGGTARKHDERIARQA